MSAAVEKKVCVCCAEEIQNAAKVCPRCGFYQSRWTIIAPVHSRLLGSQSKEMEKAAENVEKKSCAMCAEPIRLAARVCPYCRRPQPIFKMRTELLAILPLLFFGIVITIGFVWVRGIFGPGVDFEQFRHQVIITGSEMHFSTTTNGNFVSAIGNIRNDSPHAWEELQLEAQYYDETGRMIDTRSETRYSDVLPPGATHAFRIRAPADKASLAYADHKVFVRSAKDAKRWP